MVDSMLLKKKRTAQAATAIWTALCALWGAYSLFATGRDLAKDASYLQRLILSPPEWLPWAFAGLGLAVAVLVWLYWDDSSETEGPEQEAQDAPRNAEGPSFVQSHSGSGDNIGIGKVDNLHLGAKKPRMTDKLIDDIAAELDRTREVVILYPNGARGTDAYEKLKAGLISRGFEASASAGIVGQAGVYFESFVTISANGFKFDGAELCLGHQCVAIDTDV